MNEKYFTPFITRTNVSASQTTAKQKTSSASIPLSNRYTHKEGSVSGMSEVLVWCEHVAPTKKETASEYKLHKRGKMHKGA